MIAAEATEAAGEQGKFWEMADRIYSHQPDLNEQFLYDSASVLGLDQTRFKDAMASQRFLPVIEADFNEGRQRGINGTPTFIVGRTVISGLPTWDKLEAAVLKELEGH